MTQSVATARSHAKRGNEEHTLREWGLLIFSLVLLEAILGATLGRGAEPSATLIPNGGLEQVGPEGLPVGFKKYVYGAEPAIAFDTDVKKEGRHSMRVSAEEASDTAVSQYVQLEPGAAYCFTGWVSTRDLKPEPRSHTHGTFQVQDGRGGIIARLSNHKGTTDWCKEKTCFIAPPDGNVQICCFFIGFGKGTGTAWFDDLRLTKFTQSAKIVVTTGRLQKEPISPLVYGNFVELLSDLVPAMWAEKLDVTSFEYLSTPTERELRRSHVVFDPQRDPQDRLWTPIGDESRAEWFLDPEDPFNGAVSGRIRLASGGDGAAGISQGGIFVEEGEPCRFVGHFRQRGLTGPVRVALRQGERIFAEQGIDGVTDRWAEHRAVLKPSATATDASFEIKITSPGTLWVDRVSLVPERTVEGWRPDAVAAIRAMKPGVLRFGGSVIHIYDWKTGVGPWQRRVPFPNYPWGRIDPNFVGIDEFVALCRATDSEPLVCVRWHGQNPSDAADLVEYCNGAATTRYGALRAEHGHPEPYGVKYWQIGNEVGGEAYDNSIADFALAMRKADPSIKILASYISEEMLNNAGELIDYACPHHYACADLQGTEADIRRYAELLERLAPGRAIKLAVTEWNTTAGMWGEGRHTLWTLANGLACARYLNLCHRYADLVKIACRSNIANSYCSGLIQTDNHALYCTPAYYVAKLYAGHAGSHPLALDAPFPALWELDVSANLSDDGRSLSLVVVNDRDRPLTKTVDLTAFRRVEPTAAVWTIADADDAREPDAVNSFDRPERIAARKSTFDEAGRDFSYTFPAYSVTLVKLDVEP